MLGGTIGYNLDTAMLITLDIIAVWKQDKLFTGERKGIPILSIVAVLNDDYEGGEFILFDDYEIKFKAGDLIIQAAKAQAEGELAVHQANIEVHQANIEVYRTMPAGIGEHSDVTEAVIAELDKMAAAQDRLEMIEKYFSA